MIVPVENMNSPRRIGILEGKAEFKPCAKSKISEEDFLGS